MKFDVVVMLCFFVGVGNFFVFFVDVMFDVSVEVVIKFFWVFMIVVVVVFFSGG